MLPVLVSSDGLGLLEDEPDELELLEDDLEEEEGLGLLEDEDCEQPTKQVVESIYTSIKTNIFFINFFLYSIMASCYPNFIFFNSNNFIPISSQLNISLVFEYKKSLISQ